MENDVRGNDDLRRLLRGDGEVKPDQRRTRLALSRARRQIGQRDTFSFALVKIWAVLAKLVAPFFATLSEKQALMLKQRPPEVEKTNHKRPI